MLAWPFSACSGRFYLESVASGETADSDEQRVLLVEYGLLCGMSFVRALVFVVCDFSHFAVMRSCRLFVHFAQLFAE